LINEIVGGGERFVVVTGWFQVSSWLGILMTKLVGKKLILRGEADLKGRRSWLKRTIKWVCLRPLFGMADAILYSCAKNREFFRHYGVPEHKLGAVLSSVDNMRCRESIPRSEEARRTTRRRHGIPEDGLVVATVSRLTARKRTRDVIDAFAQLPRSKVHLVIVGDGPEREALARQCRQIRGVHFAGFCNFGEVSDILGVSDVFVLASEYDPTPKALNEAMAVGLGCIVSDGVGTTGDLVRNEETGLVVPCGDVDVLAAALDRLVSDADLRTQLGGNASSEVENWSPSANASELERVIWKLA